MRLALDQVGGADVDHREANALGGVDCEIEVLRDVEAVARRDVDRTLVDRLRHGVVDQLAQQHAVDHTREEGADIIHRERQQLQGTAHLE